MSIKKANNPSPAVVERMAREGLVPVPHKAWSYLDRLRLVRWVPSAESPGAAAVTKHVLHAAFAEPWVVELVRSAGHDNLSHVRIQTMRAILRRAQRDLEFRAAACSIVRLSPAPLSHEHSPRAYEALLAYYRVTTRAS